MVKGERLNSGLSRNVERIGEGDDGHNSIRKRNSIYDQSTIKIINIILIITILKNL